MEDKIAIKISVLVNRLCIIIYIRLNLRNIRSCAIRSFSSTTELALELSNLFSEGEIHFTLKAFSFPAITAIIAISDELEDIDMLREFPEARIII